ncbi:hypothetical protein FISHEDRAFT_58722 [Fistulina hepatica ATCC 64428]|uniref:Uncharacterized protein n=1 Tax=Fistulina hepatica ATCC 64428 TaxID=1128425 RepID=A0A0D7AEA8_9AGAR|nr:hypothetical protein FISHEDRAFT_58722 [Fistulina hepatica ATCC 64428]
MHSDTFRGSCCGVHGLSAKARQAVQWGNALPTCRITEANNQVVAEKAVTSWVKSWNAKRQTRPALRRGWPPIADGHRTTIININSTAETSFFGNKVLRPSVKTQKNMSIRPIVLVRVEDALQWASQL